MLRDEVEGKTAKKVGLGTNLNMGFRSCIGRQTVPDKNCNSRKNTITNIDGRVRRTSALMKTPIEVVIDLVYLALHVVHSG
jgi:hypothetical protein